MTAGIGLVLAASAMSVSLLYLAAPIAALRRSYVYTPTGSTTPRAAGLAVPTNVALDELPEAFLLALLFSEDKKFFDHRGFDFEEIGISLRHAIADGRPLRGASTLTQQLARTLFLTRDRTIIRKIREAIHTVKLERSLTKDEILLLYVNTVEWGPGVYGIGAAAAHYFGRTPADLDPRQCAFLVAILPSPTRLATAFTKHRGTPLRLQRVLAVLQRAAAAEAAGGDPNDPLVRLVPAVRQSKERAGRTAAF